MRDLIIGAVIIGGLVVAAPTYEAHHQAPAQNPASVNGDGSDTCDRLTKLFREKGYTVDQCVTENTVPDQTPQHVAHT